MSRSGRGPVRYEVIARDTWAELAEAIRVAISSGGRRIGCAALDQDGERGEAGLCLQIVAFPTEPAGDIPMEVSRP